MGLTKQLRKGETQNVRRSQLKYIAHRMPHMTCLTKWAVSDSAEMYGPAKPNNEVSFVNSHMALLCCGSRSPPSAVCAQTRKKIATVYRREKSVFVAVQNVSSAFAYYCANAIQTGISPKIQ